jgi:recombination DNA repair RAD52 pathway protein
MTKTAEQIAQEADKKIPREEVSTRSGGGGKALSYLESHYVIARMNEVFGTMGWDSETVEMREVGLSSGAKFPAYVARVKVSALAKDTDGGYMKVTKEGWGFGSDKSALNPHEMAVKEAESDAFKRAARQFGMSLGLALYSKEQENVEDATPAPQPQAAGAKAPRPAPPARDTLNTLIRAKSQVVISKRLFPDADALRAVLKKDFGTEDFTKLPDDAAQKFHTYLDQLATKGAHQ